MKKILIIFLLLFGIAEVKAYTGDTMVITNKTNVYYEYTKDGVVYSANMDKVFINGNLVYKLDINPEITTTSYSSQYKFDIDSNIKLIAYFGFLYTNNYSLDYYYATQQLIWEQLGLNVEYYLLSGGKKIVLSYDKYKKDINDRIEEYKRKVEINSKLIFSLNSINKINLTNSEGYELINNSENVITLENNNINIHADNTGIYDFTLTKKYKNNGLNFIYNAKNSATLLNIGKIDDSNFNYKYEIYSGSLNINLEKKLSEKCYEKELNTFTLYDSNNIVIKNIEVMYGENILIDNLENDFYTLKYIKNLDGITSYEYYNFEINEENRNETVLIDESLNKKTITISKTNKNTGIGYVNSQIGTKINVYDESNNLVNSLETDNNGMIELKLYCGKYTLKTSNNEEMFIEEKQFFSNEILNFSSIIPKSRIKVYLYNWDKMPLINKSLIFDNKQYVTNNSGYIVTDYFEFGDYSVRILDIEKSFNFEVSENSSFYLETDDTYVDYIIQLDELKEEEIKKIEEKSQEKDEIEETVENKEIETPEILPNLFESFNIFIL